MTIPEIIKEEENNLQSIYFHKEGLFWRAYERSAYQVVKHLRDLKAIKKCFKVADNKEIVIVGVPEKTLNDIISGQTIKERTDKRICLTLDVPLVEDDYNTWKNSVSLVAAKAQNAETNEESIKNMIKNFNIADKTPIDCMIFLSKLKNMI